MIRERQMPVSFSRSASSFFPSFLSLFFNSPSLFGFSPPFCSPGFFSPIFLLLVACSMLARSKKERERAYNRRFNSICERPGERWSISNAAERARRAGLSKAKEKSEERTARREEKYSRFNLYGSQEDSARAG